ncbi:hypothetical protein D3C80_1089870 [compost metagenome]
MVTDNASFGLSSVIPVDKVLYPYLYSPPPEAYARWGLITKIRFKLLPTSNEFQVSPPSVVS